MTPTSSTSAPIPWCQTRGRNPVAMADPPYVANRPVVGQATLPVAVAPTPFPKHTGYLFRRVVGNGQLLWRRHRRIWWHQKMRQLSRTLIRRQPDPHVSRQRDTHDLGSHGSMTVLLWCLVAIGLASGGAILAWWWLDHDQQA
jgi:hypothetical protein